MQLSGEISCALQQIEAVKKGIEESDDPKLQMNTAESLTTILDILKDPVFRTIVNIQDSLAELNNELVRHPSMLPHDFEIDLAGHFVAPVFDEFAVDDESRLSSAQISPRSPGSLAANTMVGGGYSSSTNLEPLLCDGEHSGDGMKKSRGYSDLSRSAAGEDERPQSVVSDFGKNTSDLFTSDYVQIQAIELVNDGTGLGFGIIGARTSGVIVKTILPGGVADRDGRLRSGDHILQIGDVNLHDMVSEQVAAVLRQSGTHVRLVVARPIEQFSPTYELDTGSAIVPSRFLIDPIELERYLVATGYPEIFGESSTASTPQTINEEDRFVYRGGEIDMSKRPPMATPIDMDLMELPETEKLQVELTKDANGLGITIAGYVCEKEELSGIFVKSVSPGSAADMSGRIRVNDRIIEVDGQSLQGYSNHQAVELLKKSGQVVNLRLERYLRGPKYEQLQQAIAANDKLPSIPSTPSRILPATPQRSSSIANVIKNSPIEDRSSDSLDAALPINLPQECKTDDNNIITTVASSLSTFHSSKKLVSARDSFDSSIRIIPTEVAVAPTLVGEHKLDKDYTEDIVPNTNTMIGGQKQHKYHIDPELSAEVKEEIICKWKKIVGPDVEVIVAQIKKFAAGGLGISLEGTVDVEGGREVRPHHYIRSILSDGPVGINGVLQSGDELLEVNGERLLGMNHLEVVAILKELPQDVRMVCGRGKNTLIPFSDDTLKKLSSNFENLLPASDRLVKAKSDGSLATAVNGPEDSFTKLKSRSLEPLTGLAMWSSEPQIIELIKGDRGLGFSILDYQDPLDPNDTLIVIRSLVPGGVAQLDGRLIPGDRLLFVNSINLENASLDQAVQALKGAPKGIVRIGVAKPLPMTDNSLKPNNSLANTINNANEDGEFSASDNFSTNLSSASTTTVEPDLIADWRK